MEGGCGGDAGANTGTVGSEHFHCEDYSYSTGGSSRVGGILTSNEHVSRNTMALSVITTLVGVIIGSVLKSPAIIILSIIPGYCAAAIVFEALRYVNECCREIYRCIKDTEPFTDSEQTTVVPSAAANAFQNSTRQIMQRTGTQARDVTTNNSPATETDQDANLRKVSLSPSSPVHTTRTDITKVRHAKPKLKAPITSAGPSFGSL